MSTQRVLRVDLTRADHTLDPYKFTGARQRYILQGPRGVRGEAELEWPEVLEEMNELVRAQQSTAIEASLGLRLRQFLENAFKTLQGWAGVEKEIREAEQQGQHLHLVFGFDAVELFALPWLLTQLRKGEQLGAFRYCIPQFEWTGDEPSSAASPNEGRLLFAWSEAGDPVPDGDHRRLLKESWPGFREEQDELPEVTLEKLEAKLAQAERSGQPFRILHVLCHGGAMEDGAFGLVWSAPPTRGGRSPVDGRALSRVLMRYKRSLQLVVLAACHGANPGHPGRMFGGVAHDLHRIGIPFVIASQMPLSCEGSTRMARELYRSLASDRASVHEAFKSAQSSVASLFRDWAALQLFTVSSVAPGVDRRLLRRSQRTAFSGKRSLPEFVGDELAVAYEVNNTVPSTLVLKNLKEQFPQEPDVLELRPLRGTHDGLPETKAEWKRAFNTAEDFVAALTAREAATLSQPRLHLFGRAPLPLMFHLGWLLAHHPLRVYQAPRDQGDSWPCRHDSSLVAGEGECFLQVASWPEREACLAAGRRVTVVVEVTLRMSDEALRDWLQDSGYPALIRLTPVGGPSPSAVEKPLDAARAVRDLRKYLDRIHAELPEVREVWMAFACPASLAAALGRAFNPKSQPPFLKLFNYRSREGYVEVRTLDGRVGRRG